MDIGNSFIKWATWQKGVLSPSCRESYDKASFDQWASHHWQEMKPPQRIVVANVAGPLLAQALNVWSIQHWGMEADFVESKATGYDVTNAYAQPNLLGVDRWMALIATRRLIRGNVCVVDCGTAVTIDLLNEQGNHLGGLILPGLGLMRSALTQKTASIEDALMASSMPEEAVMLAGNTQKAVLGGTLYMLIAALDRISSDIMTELKRTTRIITGGDAQALLPLLSGYYRHEPDLVLKGLATIVAEGD